jgi:hypothetical protein
MGQLKSGGGGGGGPSGFYPRRSVAVSASTYNDVIIGVTNTAAPRTITLSSADVANGKFIIIKDESGAASANNITIATEGAELIDGEASVEITADYGVIRLYSNGTNWFSY